MKRETRVLGLDGCTQRRIIGVVTRGGLYLDGVFTLNHEEKPHALARRVTETKYFPELQAIMIHGTTSELDFNLMKRVTSLPVIIVPVNGKIDGRGYEKVRLRGRTALFKTSPDPHTILEILSLTTRRGHLPEPVRIAHLLGRLGLLS